MLWPEAKIEESEKADSCRELNPGHLSGCQACNWGIQYHLCSTYSGLWGLIVVWLVWLVISGRAPVAQARDVLGLTPGDCWPFIILWNSFVPLYILSYLVANIQHTIRAYHMLWKDTTEPTIELICLHSAAWATALIYTKGPMTAAAKNGYSGGEVPGVLHTANMQEFIGYIADVTQCNIVTELLNMASLTSITETCKCLHWFKVVLLVPPNTKTDDIHKPSHSRECNQWKHELGEENIAVFLW